MSEARKPPKWAGIYLRALRRTGEVRAAAEDAGIDYTTAYQRRKHHADFAEAWDSALRLRSERMAEEEREAIAAVRAGGFEVAPSPGSPSASPPSPAEGRGAELVAAGAQVKRVGEGRWSERKEKIFFEELAATANVKRAAKAAGVSPNAVYARRMKHPLFRAKWEAVLETGRAAIEMKLVEAANKSFDPDEIDTGEVEPRVSVAEAIRIVQLHGTKAQKRSIEEMEPPEEEVDAIRERLFKKLERLRKREMERSMAEGWVLDESYDQIIPPGWIKGPDYRPKEPADPDEPDARHQ